MNLDDGVNASFVCVSLNELAKVSTPKKLKPSPIQLKSKTHPMVHPTNKFFFEAIRGTKH
jgi:hypothetical protein